MPQPWEKNQGRFFQRKIYHCTRACFDEQKTAYWTLFETLVVGVGVAEDVALLPGNTVEEFKSCTGVNPSVGRLAFASKWIEARFKCRNREKNLVLFVSHFSLGGKIIDPLWSRNEICNNRPHKRNTLPLGTTGRIDERKKRGVFSSYVLANEHTTDISWFIDNIQINHNHTSCTRTEPNTRWNSKIYRKRFISGIDQINTNHFYKWMIQKIE